MNSSVQPLESLFDQAHGQALPLPTELLTLYGALQFSLHPGKPYIVGNFVSTLDGVVSLNVPGQAGGGPISGGSPHDHLVMGLLRAVADAVIVGAGTLRAVSQEHRWTADYIYPPLASVYQRLRTSLSKEEQPLNVIVTARGEVNLALPLFQSGDVPVCLVTTPQGEKRLREQGLPSGVRIMCVPGETLRLSAQEMVQAMCQVRDCRTILVEGGPHVLGSFLAEQLLDELFLTLAPQIAGRDHQSERPGLVTGQVFAPERPLWSTLISVKRGGSHLFVRYAFQTQEGKEVPMKCEECQQELWKAGEIVPAGVYARIDDRSYRLVILEQAGPLPATFDGHMALYSPSTCWCAVRARPLQEKNASR